MIHYHGTPITPIAALYQLSGRHFCVSHTHPADVARCHQIGQSVMLDNGAFSAWKAGKATDWPGYYAWADRWLDCPTTWAVIPDVIDGNEADNDALLAEWPLPKWFGAPVWHMDESLDRLERLANTYPRICIGSSGEYATVGTTAWWGQMARAMRVLCDDEGRPLCKLHGLRMLNPEIFSRLPLSSADSTNVAQNVGKDKNWRGTYQPPTKEARAAVMRERIESINAPAQWGFIVPEVDTLIQGTFL